MQAIRQTERYIERERDGKRERRERQRQKAIPSSFAAACHIQQHTTYISYSVQQQQ